MPNIVSTGGWALVFAVEDINTGKEYALKVKYIMLVSMLLCQMKFILTRIHICRGSLRLMKKQTELLYKR